MPNKTQEYLNLAQQTAKELTRHWENWTDYLTTASRLYKYSYQALAELKRKEDALIRQIYRYHAYHSLDDPHLTLEQSILCPPQNPLDAVEQRHHLRHINDAILSLPQKQAQRCYDYYYLGMQMQDIAEKEGITVASVSGCIKTALTTLQDRCNFFND